MLFIYYINYGSLEKVGHKNKTHPLPMFIHARIKQHPFIKQVINYHQGELYFSIYLYVYVCYIEHPLMPINGLFLFFCLFFIVSIFVIHGGIVKQFINTLSSVFLTHTPII